MIDFVCTSDTIPDHRYSGAPSTSPPYHISPPFQSNLQFHYSHGVGLPPYLTVPHPPVICYMGVYIHASGGLESRHYGSYIFLVGRLRGCGYDTDTIRSKAPFSFAVWVFERVFFWSCKGIICRNYRFLGCRIAVYNIQIFIFSRRS